MSIFHFIRCDYCGRGSNPQSSYAIKGHIMRRHLQDEERWVVARTGGKDFCPDCARKIIVEKRKTRVLIPTETSGASG
jgi:DNA-directed RNA polymerase subunit RPC12/RpoP